MTFQAPIAIGAVSPPARHPRLDPRAPMVDNIARVIGAGLATRLCAAYGGHRLYIPQNPAPGDPIPAVIGYPAATRLGAVFGGERVWLPNAAGHRNRRRIAGLRRGGASVPQIAREIGCSERYVFKVLRELRRDGQPANAPRGGAARPRPRRPRDDLELTR
jgi:Homeodomain-like domain